MIVTFSPRSLLRLGVEQLVIDEPELNIRKDAQGQITVAGFAVSGARHGASPLDWLLSQTEIVVRKGTLRWIDVQRAAPELVLSDVNIVIRNGTWQHALRVDAKPPPQWGEHISFVGRFYDPLLPIRREDWRRWSGQGYVQFDRLDVASLGQYTDLATGIEQGQGALRAWVDLRRGRIVGAVVDLAIQQAKVKLDAALAPLDLRQITGRISTKIASDRFEVWTEKLLFTTQDGVQWPGGNMRFEKVASKGKSPEQGSLTADALDLGVLAHIADRIPFHAQARQWLHQYRPRGLVNTLQSKWTGPIDAPVRYALHVKAHGLAVASDVDAQTQGEFGFSGLDVDLQMSESGGKGSVSMRNGHLWLPKVFEDAALPLDTLTGQVQWDKVLQTSTQVHPTYWKVQAHQLRFSNSDAQGEAQMMWRSDVPLTANSVVDPTVTNQNHGSAGYLDLSGHLSRADTTRVHRYLPLSIPASARHYVRDAIAAGSSKKVSFKVKGDLAHLPFHDGKNGEFRIAAHVQDVTYRYVPPSLQEQKMLPWPALTQLQGELVFHGASMSVRNAKSSLEGLSGLRLSNIQAKIADLEHTTVLVSADATGPLDDMLTMVRTSPVAEMTSHALNQARAKGSSLLQLSLQLPIHALEKSEIQGVVTLSGNEVQVMPQVPVLSQAQGRITFWHQGFSLQGVQARALGGAVRLEGGMTAATKGAESAVRIQAQGIATAQGLQSMSQWGGLTALMRKASGSLNYSLQLAVQQGIPELLILSQLEGLELALPEPLRKKAGQVWPLRIQTKVTAAPPARGRWDGGAVKPSQMEASKPILDTVTISIKDKLMGVYERQHIDDASQVLRGGWFIGAGDVDAIQMPVQGVSVLAGFQGLDIDAWLAALTTMRLVPQASVADVSLVNQPGFESYMPDNIRLTAQQLDWQGRTFHDVSSHFTRDKEKWRADLDAKEFKGYAEYRTAKETGALAKAAPSGFVSDRIYARLSRLLVPPVGPSGSVDASQNPASTAGAQTKLPAIDVEVDRFAMHGKEWGRLTLKAENQARVGAPQEWRLQTLQITNPESQFTASGNWAPIGGALGANAQRRTVLNFSLDISDAGRLLDRFGMPDVVRKGHGQLAGQMAWIGSPFSPDIATMTGQMHLDVGMGQFLQADPGVAKLLGVLSLQSLPRRLALDFRDVFSKGFAFDFVRGDVRVGQGVASTNNLQMKGVSAAVLMEGTADLAAETQNLRVVVVPEINAMTASLVATAINPVIGLGSFLAQVFLRGPLIEAATQELHIDGTWSEPRVTKVSRRSGTTPNASAPVVSQPVGAGEVAAESLPQKEVQP